MHLICFTLIDYNSENDRVKYRINWDGENNYYNAKVTHRYEGSTSPSLNQTILIETELFKKYA